MMVPFTITRTSVLSGIMREMVLQLNIEDWERYLDGELVQKAFPYLTADEREFIISGIVSEEWEECFGEE